MELAKIITFRLKEEDEIQKSRNQKARFFKFFFYDSFWQNQLVKYFNVDGKFDYKINSQNICLEYVSANPTGLMHIGHARGAVLGDTLSSILKEVGHKVTDEYYINDAGEQINKLLATISFYLGQNCEFDLESS